MKWISVCLFMSVCTAVALADAPKSVSTEEYQSLAEEYTFDREKWALVPKEVEQQPTHSEDLNLPEWGSSGIFDVLGYALILFLISLIVYLIFSNIKINEKIEQKELDLDDLEEIDDVDVVSGFEAALQNGDYRLALRMQFIKLLQFLNEQRIIKWKNEKTNRDYLKEITNPKMKENFRFLSSVFERSWYGHRMIDSVAFDIANAHFITFFEMSVDE